MKKKLRALAALLALFSLFSAVTLLSACSGTNDPQSTDVSGETTEGDTPALPENPVTEIVPIEKLNTTGADGDHANDDFMTASVEIDYRKTVTLTSTGTGQSRYDNNWYPRIRKVRDNLYLLLFMYGQYGQHLYYATSLDGVNWDPPQVLYNAAQHTFAGGRYYAVNADACVLDNGDVLVVYSVRPNPGYKTEIDECGVYMMRGTVNRAGLIAFGEQTRIYTGQCWEPFIMQRSDGRVEVYFTQIAPYIAKYGFDEEKRSSGTGYLVSNDNGLTFTPNIEPGDTAYYRAKTIYQQSIGNKKITGLDGNEVVVPYFSGQMPVAVELYNGKTFLAVESHDQQDTYTVSYAVSGENGEWKALEFEEVGPENRTEDYLRAAAPYVDRFLSGELYFTYGRDSIRRAMIGAPDGSALSGREFDAVPDAKGSWGSCSVIGSHVVLNVNSKKVSESQRNIVITRAYLNHRVNAPQTTVSVDGYTNEWVDNTDALFVGSESQAQATLRTAHDSKNVYFLVSRSDMFLTEKDEVAVCIAADKNSDYRLVLDTEGLKEAALYRDDVAGQKIEGVTVRTVVMGTVDNNDDRDNGIVYEIAVPKSAVGLADADRFQTRLEVTNRDKGGTTIDTFTGVSAYTTTYWPAVVLD